VKINILQPKRLGWTILFLLIVLSALTCKKNPIMPNAEELNRPVIWLDTFDLSFVAYEAGGNPAAQSIQIKNSGKNTLEYSISDDADWLSVEPPNGSSTGQLVDHSIFINKAGLAAREEIYEATISIVSPEAYNNPQRVHVSLKISTRPPPEIWVSPSTMMFSVKVGQNPPSQTFRVKNAGEGVLTYDISWDAAWLNVAPTGGSSSGEEKSHAVKVDSKNLPEGSYDGNITISAADASNSPRSVSVTLEVRAVGPLPTDNEISISCNPATGGTGRLISIPVSIRGNLQSISTYGLVLSFDSNLFQYQSTAKGNLTGGWAVVDGNLSGPGSVTVGGFAGSANAIPVGSVGTIAVVTLRVTGSGYSSGHQSQISISSYTDDIAGMTPQPATATFTYQ
jgi:hypothetical protein